MKSIKKLSLIVASAFMLVGVSVANEAPKGKRGMDPKERAEKRTEQMVKEYSLTDTQKQQLLDLNQTFAEKMGERPAGHRHHGRKGEMAKAKKENQDGKVTRENREKKNNDRVRGERDGRRNRADAPKMSAEERTKRMEEMKQVRDSYHAELQKIMNADQYQAYAKKQTEREQKRKEHGEKMKENRTKRSGSPKAAKQA